MRILQIRFKNLNSLAGEWEIDLTYPAFVADGIFVITGPTGAGKTTILDALCLALYGRTPRLDRVNKSGNDIMSRRTGECFAEVTFATQAGRFRCHWSQKRARGKADGELQQPKHEIANADSGEIVASKVRDVAERIEAVVGMDYDRFTRSMLLAQGAFAAFLQASPDERAPILEQITGTEIYSLISIRVHERNREERETLKILQSETAGIVMLDAEREQEIQQALAARQTEEADIAARSLAAQTAIAWLDAIEGLKKDIAGLADESEKLHSDLAAFMPERDKLGRARSAAVLDGLYATLGAYRKQQADDQAALHTGEKSLAGLEASAVQRGEALQVAEQQSARRKEELAAAALGIRELRSLDQKLAAQWEAVLEGRENCRKDAAMMDAEKEARHKEGQKCSEARQALEQVDGYLKEHGQDAWLISGLAAVEEQFGGLIARRKELVHKEAACENAVTVLARAEKSLDGCRKQCCAWKQKLDDSCKSLQQGKDILDKALGGRQLREYRVEKEGLLREMAFLRKIAELEEYRAKLEDGKPCPLCGATEHPFAKGNIPAPDATGQRIERLDALIRKAEVQEAAVRSLEEAEAVAREHAAQGEKREIAALADKKAAEQVLAGLREGLEKLRTDVAGLKRAIADKLLPLGITAIPDVDVASLIASLRARLHAWQAHVAKKSAIEKQLAEILSEMQRLDAVIATQGGVLAGNMARLERWQQEYAAGSDKRKALYGDKNPDEEERRLHTGVADAEQAEKNHRRAHDEALHAWRTARSHVVSLQERIGTRAPELSELEAGFSVAIASAGFSDERLFCSARLTAEQMAELDAKGKRLDDAQTDLKARQKDRETRLAAELGKKISDAPIEALEAQCKEHEAALRELRAVIAGHRHRLEENAAAKERIREKQTAIEARMQECRRWENLHALIGSADGKKYCNFAQGLTFEVMIGHANRQLRKMTDRYLLIRDEHSPLELNVTDNWQGGEIRSAKNLSGGESFIVSLALALGLSHMAGKNVRVDSLFLDEGFGTLDEEALDTAMETLAGLRQDGKLIGVISHVPALKERISAQILVTPQSGGTSRISGPGCGSSG